MSQRQPQLDYEDSASYLLSALDLYHWGPFQGRHHVPIDARGSAIIGATGSGKTTLVDALMTLICERPKYNLASTGGLESDRDLVSYVRGKSGEGNQLDDSHIARPGKTLSAISASFDNGHQVLQIIAIFWIDTSSSAQSDLKRLWVFNHSGQFDFDQILEMHHQSGVKVLKQLARSTPNLQVNDSKKAYLSQLRRFFAVGDNAFNLLNRAAGLKQLNSIDELFRELVLEDTSAFSRATEVVQGFDTLTDIHAELQRAREQRDSLLPIKDEDQKHQELLKQRAQQQRLLNGLPGFVAERRYQLLSQQLHELHTGLHHLELEIAELERQHELAEAEVINRQSEYFDLGGGKIEDLKREQQRLKSDLQDVARQAQQYQQQMLKLGLSATLDFDSFNANQPELQQHLDQQQERIKQLEQPWHTALGQIENLKTNIDQTRTELKLVQAQPQSNLPSSYSSFRKLLAQQFDLNEQDLPYLAELVEVKPEEQSWQGAIERALGAHRLRILVPTAQMLAALNWVNQRHNQLDVRLYEANPEPGFASFMSDGYIRKLTFKSHPLREAAKQLLASIDRHCVDSAEALREIEHGLTREGMMSAKRGSFEKRDSKALNQNWMTGFDNRHRLAQLRDSLQNGEQQLQQAEAREQEHKQALKQAQQQQIVLQSLLELRFEQIDQRGLELQLEQLQQRLQQLLDPNSDTAQAQQRLQQAQQQQKQLGQQLQKYQVEQGVKQQQALQLEKQHRRAAEQLDRNLDEAQQVWMAEQIQLPESDDIERLNEFEKLQTANLHAQLERLNKSLSTLATNLVRLMGKAKRLDSGALAEVGEELRDIPDYLANLTKLQDEALPEKQKRFLDYLRSSSDQTVTQLLNGVENDVNVIKERLDDLNQTMLKVDFQPGRYLRLQTQQVVHESLRTLIQAQRHLNSARLKEDEGESHYKALQEVVRLLRHAAENRRQVGARALLDSRFRLQFKGEVVDRGSETIINTFGGSQGGSGGEKEIIASYILTASLSYALCPEGAVKPLFGSIVLDEAFSKSSQAVASRIVSALRQFGLHPLFVTPNKEMQLLRTHTRSAILIHRKGRYATSTSMSWEQLRERALQVKQAAPET